MEKSEYFEKEIFIQLKELASDYYKYLQCRERRNILRI